MKHMLRIINFAIISAASNCVCFFAEADKLRLITIPVIAVLYITINIIPSYKSFSIPTFRLRMCADGAELLIAFIASAAISTAYHVWAIFAFIPDKWYIWIISAVTAIFIESIVFWNGIIRVYCTSVQLGIRNRILGALCGWIPVINILALFGIIRTVTNEVRFETEKINLNAQRGNQYICRTKYPLLLVHGVFFRDSNLLNYWGRIPYELCKNGAIIFYGNHQSALSVKNSAEELTKRIKEIVNIYNCEKVNIIAHSKGGLDARYAVSLLGADKHVASLTTINTPHRGCLFADYLLKKVPQNVQQRISSAYNKILKKLGDKTPDFMSAVWDLTASSCEKINAITPDSADVYYQSVGSKLNRAVHAKFPLNFSYLFVKHFSGDNDGLVAEPSFRWGAKYTYLTACGKRGISHGDMIDLNRENIKGFDVREFYVQLVSDLKNKGL